MIDNSLTSALQDALPLDQHANIPALVQVLTDVLAGKTPTITNPALVSLFSNLRGSPLAFNGRNITVRDVSGEGIAIGHGAAATVLHVHLPSGETHSALHQLRPPVGDFVGREKEIEKVVNALLEERYPHGTVARISGFLGLGGVGKTELAYMVAHRVKEHFPDAQIVIDMRGSILGRSLKPEQALHTVVRAFLPLQPPPDDTQQMQGLYRSLLNDKRVLVMADDALDAAQVRPLVPPAGSALLITSRQKISLPQMTAVSLYALPMEDALDLLHTICPRLTSSARKLADLCARLPLALRVSATYLQRYPMRDIATYLQDLETEHRRIQLLRDPDDPLLDVEASLNLSYSALAPVVQAVLRQLGVFTSRFDLSAVKSIVIVPDGQSIDEVLEKLYSTSLLEYNDELRRYELHDLVRVFALDRLREAGEEADTRLRHARYYVALTQEIQRLFDAGGRQMRVALRLFDRERARISSGWRWARKHDPPNPATDQLLLDYGFATTTVGALRYHPYHDRIPQYKAMCDAAQRLGNREREGIALHYLGQAHAALGDYHQAISYYEQSLRITREIDDRKREGIALGNLGLMHAELGDYLQAILLHRQNLDIARAVDNRKGEGITLGNLGYALTLSGEPAQAIDYHTQQLAIACEREDTYQESLARSHMGLALLSTGEPDKAMQWFDEALQLARDLGDRRTEGRILDRQGRAWAALGETKRALTCYDQSIDIAHEISDVAGEARTKWRKGELLLGTRKRTEAITLMQVAVAYYQRIEHQEAASRTDYVERITR